jgi:hypothetical protein
MPIVRLSISTFLLLLVLTKSFGQDKHLPEFKTVLPQGDFSHLKSRFKDFAIASLESGRLNRFLHSQSLPEFRFNLGGGREWDILLEPSNIISADYKLKVQTQQGLQIITSHPDFLYKGRVKGSSEGEEVRLAVREGFIYGSIASGGKEYFIEPLSRFTASGKDEYILYEAKDVIGGENFSCGFQDKKNTIEKEQQRSLREQAPLSTICKKIKFTSIADYSIYQKFGGDVYAIETALLSNLNLAESVFASLNLGPDGSIDVGSDKLQFQMEEVVVSTCKECDMAPGIENVSTIGNKVLDWASKNVDNSPGKIIQYWTTNRLFDITGRSIVGTISNLSSCFGIAGEMLRYTTDDPAFLRVLIAHETGHALGCPHDDDRNPNVTGFIMFSSADGSRTRLSTLADFGGLNFSSQQIIRNTVLSNAACLEDCGANTCDEVKDLKVQYSTTDATVKFTWTGNGNYLVKYKINDSDSYNPANIKTINSNEIVLTGLDPCSLYTFEVQNVCNGNYSKASSVIFKTSSLTVDIKPVNVRSDRYDLELNLDCRHCSTKEYFIKIDGIPHPISNNQSLTQIIFKDFFSDGARHRVDISKDSGNVVCTNTSFFSAPYYRSNSTKILSEAFKDCNFPGGWKDSMLAKYNTSLANARWIIETPNFFATRTARGSFDSTCMIYYNSFNNANSGSLSLTSPKIDLTKYANVKLHYDYNFLAYTFSAAPVVGSISVEAFDGVTWQKVAGRIANEPITGSVRNIWDSLPSRVFVDLDNYINKEFQIRFIVDDGSLHDNRSVRVFAAFDNITIDGYLKDVANANIIFYPNPAKEDLFVQFEQPTLDNINYCIFDATGRLVKKDVLSNYRINLKGLSTGLFFIRLYSKGNVLTTTKIFKR